MRFPRLHHDDEAIQDELERQADRLLGVGRPDPRKMEYPYHSESWVRRASRRDGWEDPPGSIEPEPAASGKLDAIVGMKPLPPKLQEIVTLTRRGLNSLDIGLVTGVPSRTVRHWRAQAMEMLRQRALGWAEPVSAQINEVLREQVNVVAYREERHCRPGQERCRKTGLCSARWYLYYEMAEAPEATADRSPVPQAAG